MKIKLIRKIKQRIRDISNVWSVAGIRNVYVMAILPHFGSKSTRDIRRERKQQAILHYLSNKLIKNLILKIHTKKKKYPPASNQAPIWVCWWQGENAMPPIVQSCFQSFMLTCWQSSGSPYYTRKHIKICYYPGLHPTKGSGRKKSHLLIFQIFSVCVCSMSMEAYG